MIEPLLQVSLEAEINRIAVLCRLMRLIQVFLLLSMGQLIHVDGGTLFLSDISDRCSCRRTFVS